jgi:hypothetical protein
MEEQSTQIVAPVGPGNPRASLNRPLGFSPA